MPACKAHVSLLCASRVGSSQILALPGFEQASTGNVTVEFDRALGRDELLAFIDAVVRGNVSPVRDAMKPWHALSSSKVVCAFATDAATGLTETAAERHLRRYGRNIMKVPRRTRRSTSLRHSLLACRSVSEPAKGPPGSSPNFRTRRVLTFGRAEGRRWR